MTSKGKSINQWVDLSKYFLTTSPVCLQQAGKQEAARRSPPSSPPPLPLLMISDYKMVAMTTVAGWRRKDRPFVPLVRGSPQLVPAGPAARAAAHRVLCLCPLTHAPVGPNKPGPNKPAPVAGLWATAVLGGRRTKCLGGGEWGEERMGRRGTHPVPLKGQRPEKQLIL